MIIGLTGLPCAGTDSVGKILEEKGFIWLSYSDIIRNEAKKRKIEITRKSLQDLGDELRKTRGQGVLSQLLIEQMKKGKDYVIGNIRNPGEVHELRKQENFTLIKLEASEETRFKRMLERKRESDPATFEDFKKMEARDLGIGQENYGQQHQKVFELADSSINTDCTIEELKKKVLELLDKLK
jgi:dephospho-CoA kinase